MQRKGFPCSHFYPASLHGAVWPTAELLEALNQGIRSVPWKTTACKWDLCSAQHLYFCLDLLNFFTVCPRWRRDSQGESLYHVVSLPCPTHDSPCVCAPFVFSCIVSVLEKTIQVSWVSLGVTEGRRKLGKGGMSDTTRWGGQHHLVMLPLRSPPSQTGATGLCCSGTAKSCLSGASALISRLSRQQARVLAGTQPGWQWPGEAVPLAMGFSPENRKKRWCCWLRGKKTGSFRLQDLGGECK